MSRKEQLEEMLKDDPKDTFLRYALAMEFVAADDLDEGLNQMDQVLVNDPQYVPAYFQKGQVLARKGDAQSAREILQKGIVVAQQVNDTHAAGEMSEFLARL